MSFHLTSTSIKFDGRWLSADCRDREQKVHAARLDLDRCLGNDNGAFSWYDHLP